MSDEIRQYYSAHARGYSSERVACIGLLWSGLGALAACGPAGIDVNYQTQVSTVVMAVDDRSTARPRLDANWRVTSYELAAVFENSNDQEATILWNTARYTHNSVSEKLIVAFGGAPRSSRTARAAFQPPTSIPAGAKIEVRLLPRSKAAWREYTDGSGGFWYNREPMFGISIELGISEEEQRVLANMAVGEEFVISVPVQLGENVFVHLYRFHIVGAEPHAVYY